MLKISRGKGGVLPGGRVTWMGIWGCHLCQGTPRPHQGIFSCRLHSRRGLSVSHTHSVRSTFLSGSDPPPPGPCLPLGRERGWPVEGPTSQLAPVESPQGGWLLWRKACLLNVRPVAPLGFILRPGAGTRTASPREKGWTWTDIQSLPSCPVLLADHPPLCLLTSSVLSLAQARLCNLSAHTLTCTLTHMHT